MKSRDKMPVFADPRWSRENVQQVLERELEEVRGEVSQVKQTPPPQELEAGGDNTPLSEDKDRIAQVQQKELRTKRLAQLLDRAAQLEQALRRNAEGIYGICVSCNGPIEEPRLEAIPEAARCARCAAEQERVEPTAPPVEPRAAGWDEAEELYHKERYEEEF